MNKIHIGYVQGVHGLRGDLKIKNKFEDPDKIFIKNNYIYLNDEKHQITYSKLYKGFYLVTIDNLKDINLVEKYIGYDVYFNREDLSLKEGEYLFEDLIGMQIKYNNKNYGIVEDILDNGVHKTLVINYKTKFMVPFVSDFIKEVDINNKEINVQNIEGLIL